LKKTCPELILASSSPRRRELLTSIGVDFDVVPSDISEEIIPGERPIEHVKRLSRSKALHVGLKYPTKWILGADTIVVIDGAILGKPSHRAEAAEMLSRLSGRRHEVFTGYSIINLAVPGSERLQCIRSVVTIRRMTDPEIAAYIRTGEPMDKAGSYAIQGIGSAIVKRVQGSYTNVVGLPLCEVAKDLQDLKVFNFLESED
jgi:septum formation protein